MGRPKKAMPEYRFHVSGQAVVTLSGKTFYLGEHNSPESRARYLSLLQTYNENGLRMPDEVPTQQREAVLTVECVTAEFREYAEKKYKSNKSHLNRMLSLCNLLDDEYGNTPAAEFGPRKLSAIRDLFVASGNSRGYANCQTRNISYIFKHAVSRELVPPTVVVALKSLEALKRGQTTAPEPKKQQPVDLAIVRATAKHLSPTVVAMIRVQVATGGVLHLTESNRLAVFNNIPSNYREAEVKHIERELRKAGIAIEVTGSAGGGCDLPNQQYTVSLLLDCDADRFDAVSEAIKTSVSHTGGNWAPASQCGKLIELVRSYRMKCPSPPCTEHRLRESEKAIRRLERKVYQQKPVT